jgi:hypothetical protein
MNTRSDAGARCRLGLDTPAEELLNELPENAARINEFFGLLMAVREDGLVELNGMCRVGSGERGYRKLRTRQHTCVDADQSWFGGAVRSMRSCTGPGCAPLVAVVKIAKPRCGNYGSELRRVHKPRFGSVLGQGEVRPGFEIMSHEQTHIPIQRGFVEDDHVIQAISPHCVDDAFHVGMLPGRARSRKDFLDSHDLHIRPKATAEDPIAVAQQASKNLVKGTGLPRVLSSPFCRGMGGHVRVQDPPSGREPARGIRTGSESGLSAKLRSRPTPWS